MIRVQEEDFDVSQEIKLLSKGNHEIGAICTFLGLVRDLVGDNLKTLTLDHYPGMTEKELSKIERDARARWSLSNCLIIHRYGTLAPGDRIVMVVTAAPHRQAAFESCEFLMDYLKTRAPFWKKEDTGKGKKWVEALVSDDQAVDRWMVDDK